jgi:hypothetical protein
VYLVLNGGRGSKQRRNDGAGFFGLVGPPKVNTEEACPSCLPCGTGVPPAPIQGSISGESPRAYTVSPSHGRRAAPHLLTHGRSKREQDRPTSTWAAKPFDLGRGARLHDRAHPRIPASPPC